MKLKAALLLILSASGLEVGLKELVDPGNIYHPQSSSKEPVELSPANALEYSDITITFKATTSINQGIVEVHFPELSTAKTLYRVTIDIDSSQDSSLTLSSVLLGQPGIYGPLKILTKRTLEGQTIDCNLVFGNLAIGPQPAKGNLLVEGSDSQILSAENQISFSFEPTTQIWASDFIEITTPESYWAEETDPWKCNYPECSLGEMNLNCYSDGGIMVHGLGELIGNKTKISIKGFNAPGADYTGDSFEWTLIVWRSNLKLLEFKGKGPDVVLSPVNSITTLWYPTNSFSRGIPRGLSFYHTVDFTMYTEVPKLGKIYLEFSGLNVIKQHQEICAVRTKAQNVKCSGRNPLVIELDEGARSGTSFSVYFLATTEADPQLKLQLKTGSGHLIANSDVEVQNYIIDSSLLKGSAFIEAQSAGLISSPDYLRFYLSGQLTTQQTSISIDCGFSETKDSARISLDSPKVELEFLSSGNGQTSRGGDEFFDRIQSTLVNGALHISITKQDASILDIREVRLLSQDNIIMPSVESNPGTAYECRIEYFGKVVITQYQVTSLKFGTSLNYGYLCQGKLEEIPLALEITGLEVTLDHYLELTFSNSENSLGLEVTESPQEYPFYSSENSGHATVESYNSGTKLIFREFGSSQSIKLIFPSLSSTAIQSAELYLQEFSNLKNVLYRENNLFPELTRIDGNSRSLSADQLPLSLSNSITFEVEHKEVLIIAPKGFDLTQAQVKGASVFYMTKTYNPDLAANYLVIRQHPTEFELENVKTPPTESRSTIYALGIAEINSDKEVLEKSLELTGGNISIKSCSLSQGIKNTFLLEFIVDNYIPSGEISIKLGSFLSLDSAYEGLTEIEGCLSYCYPKHSTNTLEIKNVTANPRTTFKVSIQNLLIPQTNSNVTLVSEIASSSSGSSIDKTSEGFTQEINYSTKEAEISLLELRGKPFGLYLKFALNKTFPIGTEVKLTNISGEDCWSSIYFKFCQIKDSQVVMVTDQDYYSGQHWELQFEDYKSSNITLSIEWNNQVMAEKLLNATFPETTHNITLYRLDSSVSSQGELSNYYLSFALTTDIKETDSILLKFPKSFSPYLGEVERKLPTCSPNSYSLKCYSPQMPKLNCQPSHWLLNVSSLSETPAGSTVGLTLFNIRNPSLGGSFGVYLLSSSQEVKAYNLSLFELEFTQVSQVLSFKSAFSSESQARAYAVFEFEFYFESSLDSTDELVVSFPKPFDLYHKTGQLSCISSSYDSQTQLWYELSDEPCEIESNYFRQRLTYLRVESYVWLKLRIAHLEIPSLGFTAPESLRFLEYDFWTQKFQAFIYKSDQKNIFARTFGDFHSAYLGLKDSQPCHTVNELDYIVVYAGTQSEEIPIKGSPLQSRSLTLRPFADYTFSFQSVNQFTFYNQMSYITFRVSATLNTEPGIHYIHWMAQDNNYLPPVATKLEVCPHKSELQVRVPYDGTLKPNTSSPVPVSLSFKPASQVIVTVVSNSAVEPQSLNFTPGTTQKFFEITPRNSVNLSLEVSTDLPLKKPNYFLIGVSKQPSLTLSLSLERVSANEASVKITVNAPCVIRWWVTCKGNPSPTNLMKYELEDLEAPTLLHSYEPIPENATLNYFREKYTNHCVNPPKGVLFTQNTKNLNLELYSETSYTLWVLAESSWEAVENSIPFKTLEMTEFLGYTLGVTQNSTVTQKSFQAVQNSLASYVGVPVQFIVFDSFRSQEPNQYLFDFYLLSERGNKHYNPRAYFDVTSESASELAASIALQSSEILETAQFSYYSRNTDKGEPPLLEKAPELSDGIFSLKTGKGEVCAVCMNYQSANITSEQVLLGLSGSNTKENHSCTYTQENSTTALTVTADFNQSLHCYFAICNSYPVWPVCGELYYYAHVPNQDLEEDPECEDSYNYTVYVGAAVFFIGIVGVYLAHRCDSKVSIRDASYSENNSGKQANLGTPKNSKTRKILKWHLTLGLFFYRKNYSRRSRVFTITSVHQFEILVLGFLTKAFGPASSGEVCGVVAACLGVPITLALMGCLTTNSNPTLVCLGIFLGVFLGQSSYVGNIVLNENLCSDLEKLWLKGIPFAVGFQVFVIETFIMGIWCLSN